MRELAVAVVMAMAIAKTDPEDSELPALSCPLSALPMAFPPSPWPDRGVGFSAGPPAWPPVDTWPGGRPIAQWTRIAGGRADDLGTEGQGR